MNRLKRMTKGGREPSDPEIAITGIACRFQGGVRGPGGFWNLLSDGQSVELLCERSQFLAVDEIFQHGEWGVSSHEASGLDRRYSLLLQLGIEALDDAGLVIGNENVVSGGVFVSVGETIENTEREIPSGLVAAAGQAMGTSATLLARGLGLQGPAVMLNSDRASGLFALRLAIQALASGDCSMALVGGIGASAALDAARFAGTDLLSNSGQVRFGSALADGFVPSNGAVVLTIRHLEDAIADGDRVYAVVCGSALGHVGLRSDSLVSPCGRAQVELVALACKRAGIDPNDLDYIEVHGTGNPVGDQVELGALEQLFESRIGRPCFVGSVKTNVGHTEACAGLASVAKVALSLHAGILPASLNSSPLLPTLAKSSSLQILGHKRAWPETCSGDENFAGVSAFGLSGSLANVVLRGYRRPLVADREAPPYPMILPLSAETPTLLGKLAKGYESLLIDLEEKEVGQVCAVTALRRGSRGFRSFAAGTGSDALLSSLNAWNDEVEKYQERRLIFVFPGQGFQWAGMGQGLLNSCKVFSETFLRCSDFVRPKLNISLIDVLLRSNKSDAVWENTSLLQPLIVAYQLALSDALRSRGLEPDLVLGLSVGEVGAAYASGVLDLETTMTLSVLRARQLERLEGRGVMVSVGLDIQHAREFLGKLNLDFDIAVDSGPSDVVLSGPPHQFDALVGALETACIDYRQVNVCVASHSTQVDSVLDDLRCSLGDLRHVEGSIPMYSSSANMWFDWRSSPAEYWARNLRGQVRCRESLSFLGREQDSLFLEISSRPVLAKPATELFERGHGRSCYLATLSRENESCEVLLGVVGRAYSAGIDVDWKRLFGGTVSHRPLPERWPGDKDDGCGEEHESSLSTNRARVAELIVDHVADSMGVDSRSVNRNVALRSLGLTSYSITQLRARLNRFLRISVESSVFFNHPTVNELSTALVNVERSDTKSKLPVSLGVPNSMNEPIAVIGLGCRFPGGVFDASSFWEMLLEGRDSVVEVPYGRIPLADYYDPKQFSPGKSCSKWAGMLSDVMAKVDQFGLAPSEIEAFSLHQKLLLDVTWRALEDAALCPSGTRGSHTGVFIGAMNHPFGTLRGERIDATRKIGPLYAVSNANSMLSGRIAYQFGWHGPALTVDTACSSSLVAVHLAVQSLRRGECELAVAGGVNLISSHRNFVAYSANGMLSPSGRCRAFDDKADGYVRGEGCGLIVLKKMSHALRDGDPVRALIRGSAVNQDGRSNGITAPNGSAQVAVLRAALLNAGIESNSLSYVEAHGTGTRLGDPVEVESLARVFSRGRSGRPIVIGSVKTNIGHLEASAGIAGFLKVLLSMEKKIIPRSLHFLTPNRLIDFRGLGVKVAREEVMWDVSSGSLFAGVSSFGFSGTNSHVILESV